MKKVLPFEVIGLFACYLFDLNAIFQVIRELSSLQ